MHVGPGAFAVGAFQPLHVWLGLVNSDDQGTKFDVKAEVSRDGVVVSEGLVRCISGLTRDPGKAAEVLVTPAPPAVPLLFNGVNDSLAVKLSARIGTNPNGTQCAGSHASAVGLRAYFDAARRDARLDVVLVDAQ